MDRYLNVWCIWYTYLETLQECRRHHRIGWIIQDFRVCRILKRSTWKQRCRDAKPPDEKKSRCVYNCDYKRLSGSTKCWIFKSMWHFLILRHRIFKIHPRVSHTGLLLWQHFHAPKRDRDWLFDMLVKRPHGRALANERGHLFQTFSGQSEGLATQDYRHWSSSVEAEFSTLLHDRVAQSTSCHFGRLASI